MKELTVQLKGLTFLHPTVLINNQEQKIKKNEFGTYTCKYQTEADFVQIRVVRYLEINSPVWLLMSLLFFFVSIFGIFDAHYDKNCVVLDCLFNVYLTGNNAAAFTASSTEGRGVELMIDCPCEELSNKRYVDKAAKTKLKILLGIKILLWISAIALLIYCVARAIG